MNSTLTRGVMTLSAVISESPRRFLICFFSSSSTAPHSCDISMKASTSDAVILVEYPPPHPIILATNFTNMFRKKERGEKRGIRTLYIEQISSSV
jgi:hypothetical protein